MLKENVVGIFINESKTNESAYSYSLFQKIAHLACDIPRFCLIAQHLLSILNMSMKALGKGERKNIYSSKNPLFDEGKELLVTFPLFHYLDHINGLKTAVHLVPHLWKCSLLPGCFFSVQNFVEVCAHFPLVNNNVIKLKLNLCAGSTFKA